MEVVSGAMRQMTACSPDAGWLLDNRLRLPRPSWRTHSEAKDAGELQHSQSAPSGPLELELSVTPQPGCQRAVLLPH